MRGNETNQYPALGGIYPFVFHSQATGLHTEKEFERIIGFVPEGERWLDPVGVAFMVSRGHICGDCTLVEGLRRSPWAGNVLQDGSVDYAAMLPHGDLVLPAEEIARKLISALRQEMREACDGRSEVWLLLSGGLDSRMAAGVLAQLQMDGEVQGRIRAATWGVQGSRDVVYAQRIAQRFGWDWHHIVLDASQLGQNFDLSSRVTGAEIPPIHLHGMSWFENRAAPDGIVLATTYGDNIGRGDFGPSGRIPHLRMMGFEDSLMLLLPHIRKEILPRLKPIFDAVPQAQQASLPVWRMEMLSQANRMRRLWGSTFSVIDRMVPVVQLFTHPAVYGLMWSLDSSCRNDRVYQHALPMLDPFLVTIPWARDGLPITGEPASPDSFRQDHHHYGEWLREGCRELVEANLMDGTLERLNVFDMRQVETMTGEWLREPPRALSYLSGVLSWMACLSMMCRNFYIQPARDMQRKRILEPVAIARFKGRMRQAYYLVMWKNQILARINQWLKARIRNWMPRRSPTRR